ncbi:MAG: hypothetical protein J6M02_04015 [Clostridia bacterium]|nr:hypothetical protein [Clostridia bacterium]
MKKIGAVFIILMFVTMLVPKFCYAEGEFDFAKEGQNAITTEKVEETIDEAANTVNNVVLMVIGQISDKSLPICLLLILWGAVQYFIMGIRNLYKKRNGMLLMWGSFTFMVIAKFVYLIVFLVSLRF